MRRSLVATVVFSLLGAVGALAPVGVVAAVQSPQALVVSANPANHTPHVLDGRVYGIAEVGLKVIVAGTFTRVRNQNSTIELTRNRIFAYDKNSGFIDDAFVPRVDGTVNDVEAGPGNTVYLGGAFLTVNDVASRGLAKLNVADGSRVTAFGAPTTASVEDIVLRGGTLYVGGEFGKVKNLIRTRLAAVNATTGAVNLDLDLPVTDPIIGTAGIKQLDVTPDGSRLVIVGNFRQVNGTARHQVALIDLTTSPDRLANWDTQRYTPRCNPAYDTYLRGVDFSPDGRYFVAVTTGSSFVGTLCDTAARFETMDAGGNIEPTWVNYTGGDTLYSVAITNAAVYVGGHQRWLGNRDGAIDEKLDGAVDRPGIGALDPLTGVVLRWNPGRTRGVGAFVLEATADGLYVGSDTTTLGGESHFRLGWFPLAGGSPNPAPVPATLPADLFVARFDGTLAPRAFDGASFGSPRVVSGPAVDGVDWTLIRGAFMANEILYSIHSDGTMKTWTWNGTRFVSPVNLAPWFSLAGKSVLAYVNGRIFYTSPGSSGLVWRRFSLESGLIGSEVFVADTGTGGAGWQDAVGLTAAGGKLYTAHASGNLTRTDLNSDSMPIAGTTVVISGPAAGDGRNWNVVDLFVFSSAPK